MYDHCIGTVFHSRAMHLVEAFGHLAPCTGGQVLGILLFHGSVILKGNVIDLYLIEDPLPKKFDVTGLHDCRSSLTAVLGHPEDTAGASQSVSVHHTLP